MCENCKAHKLLKEALKISDRFRGDIEKEREKIVLLEKEYEKRIKQLEEKILRLELKLRE
jgi:hypothetical protein